MAAIVHRHIPSQGRLLLRDRLLALPRSRGRCLCTPETGRPLAVGSRAVVTRRVGPRELSKIENIAEFDPPRRWTVRGVGGPVVAVAGTIDAGFVDVGADLLAAA
jgi:hypothetical protein